MPGEPPSERFCVVCTTAPARKKGQDCRKCYKRRWDQHNRAHRPQKQAPSRFHDGVRSEMDNQAYREWFGDWA